MRTSRNTTLVRVSVVSVAVLAACSDATAPREPRLAKASPVVWLGPDHGEVEPGKLKVCKMWEGMWESGPALLAGGSATVQAFWFDNYANGTLSTLPGPYTIPKFGCVVIGTSTEPSAMDEAQLSELVTPGTELVSALLFRGSEGVPYESGMIIGFNAQYGATVLYTNRVLLPAGGEVEPGKLKVCKAWVGPSGGNVTVTASNVFDEYLNGTLTLLPGPYSIPANGCTVIATSTEVTGRDELTLREAPNAGVELVLVAKWGGWVAGSGPDFIGIGAGYGSTVLFMNRLLSPPPSTGCTNTAVWYRTKGSESILPGIDGRSADAQRLIFAATPGKKSSATWDGGKETLDLYQELLAALNNLGGNSEAGPPDVDAAIAGALAITAGSGTNIDLVGNPTKREIRALTDILSAFNAGKYEGWPRCTA